jgi:hypothetical protein
VPIDSLEATKAQKPYFDKYSAATLTRIKQWCDFNLTSAGAPYRGPVCIFIPRPPTFSLEGIYHSLQYVSMANFRMFFVVANPGCPMIPIRGPVNRSLKRSATDAFRQLYGSRPGYNAGHVPDSVFAAGLAETATPFGRYFPPIWLQMNPTANSTIGSQQARYPNGYQATVFIAIDLTTGLPYPPLKARSDWNWIQNPNPCPTPWG